MGGVCIAYIDDDIHRFQQLRIVLDILKADKLHIKRCARQHFDHARIAVILLVVEGMMHHVTAPCPHFTPAVQHSHPFDAVRRSALDILIQFAELLADALHIVHKLRELQCQLQIATIANAVNGRSQDGAAGCDPVLLGFPHRVAALMERVREEVRQKASFRVLHALDVID